MQNSELLKEIAEKCQSKFSNLNIVSNSNNIYICEDIKAISSLTLIDNKLGFIDLADPDLMIKLFEWIEKVCTRIQYMHIIERVYEKYKGCYRLKLTPWLIQIINEYSNTNYPTYNDFLDIRPDNKLIIIIDTAFAGLANTIENPENFEIRIGHL